MTLYAKDYLKPGDRVRALTEYTHVPAGAAGRVTEVDTTVLDGIPRREHGGGYDYIAQVEWDDGYDAPGVFWFRLEKISTASQPELDGHFNGLTPAEDERLAMLIEECAEIIVECTKIQRHGYGNYHPDEPNVSNRLRLQRELGELCEVQKLMIKAGDLQASTIAHFAEAKQDRMRDWTHHQQGLIPPAVRSDDH